MSSTEKTAWLTVLVVTRKSPHPPYLSYTLFLCLSALTAFGTKARLAETPPTWLTTVFLVLRLSLAVEILECIKKQNGKFFCFIFSSSYNSVSCYLGWWAVIPPNSVFTFVLDMSAAAAAKSLQSCPTLCNPTDGRPPGSPVPGILQAKTLEWVAISFSNAWKGKVKGKSLSCARPSATPWTAAFQAPPSMGFSRQEYWSGVPLHSYRTNRNKTWVL